MNRELKEIYNSLPIVKIGGPGIIVEIDESKFGKVKYHRGHRVEGVWVFGMVENTPERKIILIQVEDRKRETLEAILSKHVHPDSIIHSDCWRAYSRLSEIFAEHETVNHSTHFSDPISKTNTNTIEGNWFGVKNQVTSAQRTAKSIDAYLIRFMFNRIYGENMFFQVVKFLLQR